MNLKAIIRKKAKSILHTYMKDNDTNPMKYWFSAVKYIMIYQ